MSSGSRIWQSHRPSGEMAGVSETTAQLNPAIAEALQDQLNPRFGKTSLTDVNDEDEDEIVERDITGK